MRLFSLFFLFGTVFVQYYTLLPSLLWVVLLLTLSLTVTVFTTVKFNSERKNLETLSIVAVAFFTGLALAVFSAQKQLDTRLATALEGQDILLQGVVVDIPEYRNDGLRFRLKVESAYKIEDQQPVSVTGIVRLGWYQSRKQVSAGERWQLRVRMKQPSGFMNPGGFDYEKWLFSERIIATGYIRKINKKDKADNNIIENRRLETAPWWSVNRIRQNIHETIQQHVVDKSAAAVLSALSVANRSKLDRKQWEQLQQTGTSHLVAISGLHIAIVAGFAFFPIFLLWRIFPSLNEKIPVRVAGGFAGIIMAAIYAMLAGFTLPTQRALLMVIIALLGLVSRRNYPASSILAVALLAVLILDPLAGMTISFWLSFLAVAIILIIAKRQIKINRPRLHIVSLQIVLSLGMFPLSLLFFGTASLSSPFANLFAIPWVSLVIVPMTLLGVLFMPLISVLSDAFFNIAALAVTWLFRALNYLSSHPLFTLNLPEIPVVYLMLAFSGFLFVLLPKGFPGRWLSIVFVLPALLFSPQKPAPNAFSYTLLDAGQGMASVLRTNKHTLVYDVGARVNDNFDVGRLVVVPYLKAKGLTKVNLLMISHEDMDHRGGSQAVLESVTVINIQSSDLTILPQYRVDPCKVGDKWEWDGVDFEVLSPPAEWLKKDEVSLSDSKKSQQIKDNDLSCVLRVSNEHHSLLLTGDIQKRAEALLVEKYSEVLQSEVIIVPHHGSRTSSTEKFIKASNPKLALVPAGYRNRFGHPKEDIVSRYLAKNITVLDTVEQGALEIEFPSSARPLEIKSWRKEHSGFWSR